MLEYGSSDRNRVLRALVPPASLVVIAEDEISGDVAAVMQSGAHGYLSNNSAPELVLQVLSFVLGGGLYFPRSAIRRVPFSKEAMARTTSETCDPSHVAAERNAAALPLHNFSDRQKAILRALCRGEPNKLIGRALNLPETTVKVHVREIMRKLNVSNRTQVAVAASRMNAVLEEAAPTSSPLG